MPMTAADVEAFALSLPETVKGDHGHRPAFRVSKHLFAVIETDGDEALLYVDPHERETLLSEAPDALREARSGSGRLVESWIVVDLARADPDLVRELLEDAWRRFATKRAIAARDRVSD